MFICLSSPFSHRAATLCFSLLTEADAGHTEFMDEVYQNETRFPGGEWKAASEPYTDVVRETIMKKNNLVLSKT